jgi:hypothetical protein
MKRETIMTLMLSTTQKKKKQQNKNKHEHKDGTKQGRKNEENIQTGGKEMKNKKPKNIENECCAKYPKRVP